MRPNTKPWRRSTFSCQIYLLGRIATTSTRPGSGSVGSSRRETALLTLIAFCIWTMHFSALISAARDAVLEAPSPFHSIRFPGQSENLSISSFSSLYINPLSPSLHPPLTAVQIFMTDTNTQTGALIFFLFFFFILLFRLAFIFVSFFSQCIVFWSFHTLTC